MKFLLFFLFSIIIIDNKESGIDRHKMVSSAPLKKKMDDNMMMMIITDQLLICHVKEMIKIIGHHQQKKQLYQVPVFENLPEFYLS